MENSDGLIREEGTVEILDAIFVKREENIDNLNSGNKNCIITFDVKLTFEDILPLKINDLESFNNIKLKILKSHYISLYMSDYNLHIVTDSKLHYLIDLNNIPIDDLAKLFIFRNPKKIVFGMNEYKDLILEYSEGFWDLQLLVNILWGVDVKNPNQLLKMVSEFEISKCTTFFYCFNLIAFAKAINIYVEKNKLNQSLMLELDILKESKLCEKSGVPIDIQKYEEYKKISIDNFNKLHDEINIKYGNEVDFDNIDTLFDYLNRNNKIPSLEPSILEKENSELLNDLKIINIYKNINEHIIEDNKFIIQYDTYYDFGIIASTIPEDIFLDSDQILVEGSYKDLYYKVLCELTKDKDLIKFMSTNKFIEYFNANILENKNLGVYSEIFIKSFSNEHFDTIAIQTFAQHEYKTVISEADINYILELFNTKVPRLMDFFFNFDGEDVIYERYNKKIFKPSSNLDSFIKQIENLIFKTAISYVKSAIVEYNTKYKNDEEVNLGITAFYDSKIILSATERSLPISIDILNRYMALSYKKFIKNTKYYNNTRTVTK